MKKKDMILVERYPDKVTIVIEKKKGKYTIDLSAVFQKINGNPLCGHGIYNPNSYEKYEDVLALAVKYLVTIIRKDAITIEEYAKVLNKKKQ